MSKKEDLKFEGVRTLGKIYHSMLNKKELEIFFLDSALLMLEAQSGCLYLMGPDKKLRLELKTDAFPDPTENCVSRATQIFNIGKPINEKKVLFIPLVIGNNAMGLAAFIRAETAPDFQEHQLNLGTNLSDEAGRAIKNILLLERTVEIEKLAAIGQSMSMVLHEIKNIIQLATFADEWLKRGLNKNNRDYLERGAHGISKALREMNGFIYEILSLTKNYKVVPQQVNLKILLDELRIDLGEKAQQLNIRFEIETDAALGMVECEERSMYRSVLNLVKNAMEACNKPNPWVKVEARVQDDEHYTISVSDNGQGMTDEVKAKIRQAFFSTKGEQGTGLGVLVVERTLTAHGGQMTIASEAGHGSVFTLTLPKKLTA